MAIDNINDPWRNEEEQPEIRPAPPPAQTQQQNLPAPRAAAVPQPAQQPAPVQQPMEMDARQWQRVFNEDAGLMTSLESDSGRNPDSDAFAQIWALPEETEEWKKTEKERLLTDPVYRERQRAIDQTLGMLKDISDKNTSEWYANYDQNGGEVKKWRQRDPGSGLNINPDVLARMMKSQRFRDDTSEKGERMLGIYQNAVQREWEAWKDNDPGLGTVAWDSMQRGLNMSRDLLGAANDFFAGALGNISDDEAKYRAEMRGRRQQYEAGFQGGERQQSFWAFFDKDQDKGLGDFAEYVVESIGEQMGIMGLIQIGTWTAEGIAAAFTGGASLPASEAIRQAGMQALKQGGKQAIKTASKGAIEAAAKKGGAEAFKAASKAQAIRRAAAATGGAAMDLLINTGDTMDTLTREALERGEDINYGVGAIESIAKTAIDYPAGFVRIARNNPLKFMRGSQMKISYTATGRELWKDIWKGTKEVLIDSLGEGAQEMAQKLVDRAGNRYLYGTWLLDGEKDGTEAFKNDVEEGMAGLVAGAAFSAPGQFGKIKRERKEIRENREEGRKIFNADAGAPVTRFLRDAIGNADFEALSANDQAMLLAAVRALAQKNVGTRRTKITAAELMKEGETDPMRANALAAEQQAQGGYAEALYGERLDQLRKDMSDAGRAWFDAYCQGYGQSTFKDYDAAVASATDEQRAAWKSDVDLGALRRNEMKARQVGKVRLENPGDSILFDDSPKGDGKGGHVWIRGYVADSGEVYWTVGRSDGGAMPMFEGEEISSKDFSGTAEQQYYASLGAAIQFADKLGGWARWNDATADDALLKYAQNLVQKQDEEAGRPAGKYAGRRVVIVRGRRDLENKIDPKTGRPEAEDLSDDAKETMFGTGPTGLSNNWEGYTEKGTIYINRSKVSSPLDLAAILDHETFHDSLDKMANDSGVKLELKQKLGIGDDVSPSERRAYTAAYLLGIDLKGRALDIDTIKDMVKRAEETMAVDAEGARRVGLDKEGAIRHFLREMPVLSRLLPKYIAGKFGIRPDSEEQVGDFLYNVTTKGSENVNGSVVFGRRPNGVDGTNGIKDRKTMLEHIRYDSQKKAAQSGLGDMFGRIFGGGEGGGKTGGAAPAASPRGPKAHSGGTGGATAPTTASTGKSRGPGGKAAGAIRATNVGSTPFQQMTRKAAAVKARKVFTRREDAERMAKENGGRMAVWENGDGTFAVVWRNGDLQALEEEQRMYEMQADALARSFGGMRSAEPVTHRTIAEDEEKKQPKKQETKAAPAPAKKEAKPAAEKPAAPKKEPAKKPAAEKPTKTEPVKTEPVAPAKSKETKPAEPKAEAPAKPAPAAKKLPPVSNKGKPAVLRTLMPKAKAAVKAMLDWLQKGTYTPGTYGKEPVRMIPMTYRSKGGEVVKSPIVVHNGRPYILLDMGGVAVPWYLNNAKTQWLPAIEGADSAKIGDKQILGSRSMHFVSQALMQEIGNGFAVIRGDDFKDYQTGKGETLDAVKMLDAETGRKAIEAFTTKENDAVDPETLAPKQAEREDQSFEGRLREQKKAADPATKPEDLASLATSSDDSVRLEVASNPSTPKEALRVLATDTNAIVGSMARRRFTDAELKKIDSDFEKATRSIANGTARGAQANIAETEKSGDKRRIGPRNRTKGLVRRNYIPLTQDIADAMAVALRRNLGIKTDTQESDPAGAKASAEKAAAWVKARFKKLGMTDADISAHMGAFYDGVEDILKGGGAVAKESGKGGQKKNGKGTKSLRADKRETTKPVASGSAANWTPPAKTTKTKTNAKGQKTLKTEPVVPPKTQRIETKKQAASARLESQSLRDSANLVAAVNGRTQDTDVDLLIADIVGTTFDSPTSSSSLNISKDTEQRLTVFRKRLWKIVHDSVLGGNADAVKSVGQRLLQYRQKQYPFRTNGPVLSIADQRRRDAIEALEFTAAVAGTWADDIRNGKATIESFNKHYAVIQNITAKESISVLTPEQLDAIAARNNTTSDVVPKQRTLKRGQSDEAKSRVAAKKEADAKQREENAKKGKKKRSLKANQTVDLARLTTTGETDENGRPVLTEFGWALRDAQDALDVNKNNARGEERVPMSFAASNALTLSRLIGYANQLIERINKPTLSREEKEKIADANEREKYVTPEEREKAKQQLRRGDWSPERTKAFRTLKGKKKAGTATEEELNRERELARNTRRGVIPRIKALLGNDEAAHGVVERMFRGEDVTADLDAAVARWEKEAEEKNIIGYLRGGRTQRQRSRVRRLVDYEARRANETEEQRARRLANRQELEDSRVQTDDGTAREEKPVQQRERYDTQDKIAEAPKNDVDKHVDGLLDNPQGNSLADIVTSIPQTREVQRRDGTTTRQRARRVRGRAATVISGIHNPTTIRNLTLALESAVKANEKNLELGVQYAEWLRQARGRWQTLTGTVWGKSTAQNLQARMEPYSPLGMDFGPKTKMGATTAIQLGENIARLSDEGASAEAVREAAESGYTEDVYTHLRNYLSQHGINTRADENDILTKAAELAETDETARRELREIWSEYGSVQSGGTAAIVQPTRQSDADYNADDDTLDDTLDGHASSIGTLLLSRVADDYVLPDGRTKRDVMAALRAAINRVGDRNWAQLTDEEKDSIYNDTGWEMRADGEWGYRVPPIMFNDDTRERIEKAVLGRYREEMSLFDALDETSAQMLRAMDDTQIVELDDGATIPDSQFGDIKVIVRDLEPGDRNFGDSAWFDPINREIVITTSVLEGTTDDSALALDKIITHEMQHVIQEASEWSDRTPGRATSGPAYHNAMSEVDARAAERMVEQAYDDADAYEYGYAADVELEPSIRQEVFEDVPRSEQIDGRQKQADAVYPDASAEIKAMPEGNASSFRSLAMTTLQNKRPDLDAQTVLDEVFKFPTAKERKISLHWIVRGGLALPQDAYKVADALSVAEKAKVDPFRYKSPEELLLANKDFKPSARPIDPATVPELSDARDEGDGIVSYLVQDDREGQAAMRRIIDTHWGEDANPWCLLARDNEEGNDTDLSDDFFNWLFYYHGELYDDGETVNDGVDVESYIPEYEKETGKEANNPGGGLSSAWGWWNCYSALPKRVAFKNGRLLSFMATDRGQGDGKVEFSKPENERRVESFYKEYSKIDKDERPGNFQQWMMEEHPEEYDAIAEDEEDGGDAINTYQFSRPAEEWWDRKDESHPDLDWAKEDGNASSLRSLAGTGVGAAYGVTNRDILDRLRRALNDPALNLPTNRTSMLAIFNEGSAILEETPMLADQLVTTAIDKMVKGEEWTPPSAAAYTILEREMLLRTLRRADAEAKLEEAANTGGDVTTAQTEKAEALAAEMEFAAALRNVKRTQAHELLMNKVLQLADYSYAGVIQSINDHLEKNGDSKLHPEQGRPLTAEEIKKYGIAQYVKKIAALEKKLADREKKLAEKTAQLEALGGAKAAMAAGNKAKASGKRVYSVEEAKELARKILAARMEDGGTFDPNDYAETWGAIRDLVKMIGDAIAFEYSQSGQENMSYEEFASALEAECNDVFQIYRKGDNAAALLDQNYYRDLYAGIGRLDRIAPREQTKAEKEMARMQELTQRIAELERVKNGELTPERYGKGPVTLENVDKELADVRSELNKLLRESGLSDASPHMKKTPLDRAKETLMRRILEIDDALDRGVTLPGRENVALKRDAEEKFLREYRARLQALYDDLNGPSRSTTSDADRAANAIARLEELIARTQQEIADAESGLYDASKQEASTRRDLSSPEVSSLRAMLSDLRRVRDAARENADPVAAARLRLEHEIERQNNRRARFENAVREGVAKRPAQFSLNNTNDKEWVDAYFSAEKAKRELGRIKGKIAYDRKTLLGKAWATANSIKDTMRAYMASGDISGLGVQCAWYVLQHPRKAMKTIIPGLQAFFSEEKAIEVTRMIMSDPDFITMKEQMGVSFSLYGIESGYTQTEEAFARGEAASRLGAWADNKYLQMSERGFIVPINLCRFALAKEFLETMRDNRGENGHMSDDELRYLGRIVNIATGKGDFFGNAGASNFLSQILWAPSRVSSQIQILALPLTIWAHGEIGADLRREILAKSVVTPLAHLAVMMVLLAMAGRMIRPDDDDEEIIGTDPTSSKFGKVKIGNRYMSLTGGLEQYITLLARTATGFKRDKKGKKIDLRGGFGRNIENEWLRWAKNKLRPDISMAWQFITGRDALGNELGPSMWGKNGYAYWFAKQGFIPITGGDIASAFGDVKTNGLPLSMIFAAMAFVGWNGSNFGETPYTKDLYHFGVAKEALEEGRNEAAVRNDPAYRRYLANEAALDANLKEQRKLEGLLKNGESLGKDLRGNKKYRQLVPREVDETKRRIEELQMDFHMTCWPDVYNKTR